MEHHEHTHTHSHSHHHPTQITKLFVIGIILNASFVLIELIAGFFAGSLALITDAGHNFGDVAGLAMVLVAEKLSKRKANSKYTYGYGKTTVLVALANAALLLIGVGAIALEAILRIHSPHIVEGKTVSIVAFIGIIINGLTALLFFRDKESDLNIKGAYLHMASDAIVSLGVVISGILIIYTHYEWIDTAMSLLICVVIIWSTFGLLKDSLRLSLDGVPDEIKIEKIRHFLLNIPEVADIHDLHIWALSTKENALTAHLLIKEKVGDDFIMHIRKELTHHFNISHTTIQLEASDSTFICEQKC
ncbi:MAG TPA: cation diffusion facilitator family transporter [Bacteroidia bacterium]|nr:cation diffusion facilitator family transporter [Bacteroidia bacterium]